MANFSADKYFVCIGYITCFAPLRSLGVAESEGSRLHVFNLRSPV